MQKRTLWKMRSEMQKLLFSVRERWIDTEQNKSGSIEEFMAVPWYVSKKDKVNGMEVVKWIAPQIIIIQIWTQSRIHFTLFVFPSFSSYFDTFDTIETDAVFEKWEEDQWPGLSLCPLKCGSENHFVPLFLPRSELYVGRVILYMSTPKYRSVTLISVTCIVSFFLSLSTSFFFNLNCFPVHLTIRFLHLLPIIIMHFLNTTSWPQSDTNQNPREYSRSEAVKITYSIIQIRIFWPIWVDLIRNHWQLNQRQTWCEINTRRKWWRWNFNEGPFHEFNLRKRGKNVKKSTLELQSFRDLVTLDLRISAI